MEPGVSPERSALDRLVKALLRKHAADQPKTYGGTLAGISEEMESDHRKALGAQQEYQAALINAQQVLANK